MDWLNDIFLSLVADQNNLLAIAALAGSAALEYVFPPFPGDTITLLGAILITAYDWNFALVFGAVMVGSVGGAMLSFKFGQAWAKRRMDKMGAGAKPLILDEMVAKFRRLGPMYLVLNRFMPGIRTLFFVAAGLANMRTLPVLFYSALSALLWNLGLIAIGSLLGANLDELKILLGRYTLVVWILIAIVFVFMVWRFWRKRKRQQTAPTIRR